MRRSILFSLFLATWVAPVTLRGEFIRGDADGSGEIDIVDVVRSLNHLFLSQPSDCVVALDANDDDEVDIADPLYLLAYAFDGGPTPPAPFPSCGTDPTPSALDCAVVPVACAPPRPFEFTSAPVRVVAAGASYEYQVKSHPAAPAVEFELSVSPAGMSVDSSGRVEWVPTAAQLGLHSVSIRAETPVGYVTLQEYSVRVFSGPVPTADIGAPLFEVGDRPAELAAGDFNGDGVTDVAVAFTGEPAVKVFVGTGGSFSQQWTIPLLDEPRSVVAADLNGDGVLDLAMCAAENNKIGYAFGNGDGTFDSVVLITTGSSDRDLAVGDFSGDGSVDLVALGSQEFMPLRGNGDGTFVPLAEVDLDPMSGGGAQDIALEDFDGDGNADLAVLAIFNPTQFVRLYWGDGTGGFVLGPEYTVGVQPRSLVVFDPNLDGAYDIAVANLESDDVTLLINNGAGAFATSTIPIPGAVQSIASGDLNGDGWPDLATGDSQLITLVGNGNGTFQSPVSHLTPVSCAYDIVLDDFDLDGVVDALMADYCEGSLHVSRGLGMVQFAEPATHSMCSVPWQVALADLDGDGRPDLVATCDGTADIHTSLGNGAGGFEPPVFQLAVGDPRCLRAEDVNADGAVDIVVLDVLSGELLVATGNGDGTFASPFATPVFTTPSTWDCLVLCDWNGDGHIDVVASGGEDRVLVLFSGNSTGAFQLAGSVPIQGYPTTLQWGDWNYDGAVDFAVSSSPDLEIFLGRPGDLPLPGPTVPELYGSRQVEAADLTGDGIQDLALMELSGNGIKILTGIGDGSFSVDEIENEFIYSIRVVDVDGDGRRDLLALNSEMLFVYAGNGDGTFEEPRTYQTIGRSGLLAQDLDLDGDLDVTIGSLADFVEVLLNRQAP